MEQVEKEVKGEERDAATMAQEMNEIDISEVNRKDRSDSYLVGGCGGPSVLSSSEAQAQAEAGQDSRARSRLELNQKMNSDLQTSSSPSSRGVQTSAFVGRSDGYDHDGGSGLSRPETDSVTNNVPSSSHPELKGDGGEDKESSSTGGQGEGHEQSTTTRDGQHSTLDSYVKAALSSSSSSSSPSSSTTLPNFFSPSVPPNASPSAASPYPSSHALYAAATKLRIPYRGISKKKKEINISEGATSSSSLSSQSQTPKLDHQHNKNSPSFATSSKSRDLERGQTGEEDSKTSNNSTDIQLQQSNLPREQSTSPKLPSPSSSSSSNMPARRSSPISRNQQRPSPLDITIRSISTKPQSSPDALLLPRNNRTPIVKVEEEEDKDGITNDDSTSYPFPSSAGSQEASFASASSWNAPSSLLYHAKEEDELEPTSYSNFSASVSPYFTDRFLNPNARPVSPSTSIDLRSTIADDDDQEYCGTFSYQSSPNYFSNDHHEFGTSQLRLPLTLPRPAQVHHFDAHLETLEFDRSLAEVPVAYLLDKLFQQGSRLLSAVVESSIALPNDGDLPVHPSTFQRAIPLSIAVRTPASCCETATPPDYALAVSSEDSKQVMILPIHGLVLASNCKSFAALAKSWPVDLPVLSPEALGAAADDTVRVLPVVHIHLPSSRAFSSLVPFFYTPESGALLSTLLPLHSVLPDMPMTALQRNQSLLVGELSKLDQHTLLDYVHANHAVWRTAVALGAGRDDLWHTLSSAWNTLVSALAVQAQSPTI